MDLLKKLELDYQGIKDVIFNYKSGGYIGNYIEGLEHAIKEKNVESIKYFLEQISMWYHENINKIHSNEFVYNGDEHDKNKKLIEDFNARFTNYVLEENNEKEIKKVKPIIFLSHKSDDKKYADALEKLICGMGIKNNQLIYTSHPLHKIPLDHNIYDFLRNNLNLNTFVIILWSNNYLESPACLNEMGAAWVVQSDYTNIYTPDFEFGNPKYHECAVDTRKMGAVLKNDAHCKASMVELKNKITKLFNIEVDEQTWMYLLDKFLEEIV